MRALAVWLLALGLVLIPVAAGARTEDAKKDTAEAKKPDAKPEEPKKSAEKTKEEGAKPNSTL
jgi:hypothetical protein